MATEIGSITALIGTATATSLDGTVRNLQVGDKVFQNDIITTGAAGAIEIEFNDGNVMDMGRDSQAVLDSAVFDPDAPVAETAVAEDVFDDIEAIQQALLEGEDPTLIADPAAAGQQGEGTSEGGNSTVVRDYINPSMTPQNGFDTTGPTISFLTPEPTQFLNLVGAEGTGGDLPDAPIPPPPTDSPVNLLSMDTLSFSEANLGTGTAPDASVLTKTGGFTVSAPDGLQTLSVDGQFIIESGDFDNDNLPTITSASGNTLTITDVSVNLDGTYLISYTFTLNSAVEHSQPENDDELDKTFQIVATDINGSTDSADLIVSIEDDSPIVTSTQPEIGFEMTVTNLGSVTAAFNNSYGYYIKGENGEPLFGEVIFANVKHNVGSTVSVQVEGFTSDDIGFFIIPNGASTNSSLSNDTEVTFQQLSNGNWQAVANINGVITPLNGTGSPALFDNNSLNRSDYDYLSNNENPGNQNWEDINGGGDRDDNDVNINVAIINLNLLTVNERFLVDGDENTVAVASLDITQYFSGQYGADGPGSSVYRLNIDNKDSGLTVAASGEPVSLRLLSSGVVEGYIEGSDEVVFTVSIEDGVVILEQFIAVFHDEPTDSAQTLSPATINPSAISVVLTVTDDDGDVAQASIDLGAIMAFTYGESAEHDSSTFNAIVGTNSPRGDFLVGTDGNDIFTGNAGPDTFVWKDGHAGTEGTPAFDIVTDFSAAEGDVLDFSDLLQGEESGDITDFISVIQSGDDVLINLTPEGNGEMTQTVKLKDTNFNDLGIGGFDAATQQAQIIDTLISNGQLNVDQS